MDPFENAVEIGLSVDPGGDEHFSLAPLPWAGVGPQAKPVSGRELMRVGRMQRSAVRNSGMAKPFSRVVAGIRNLLVTAGGGVVAFAGLMIIFSIFSPYFFRASNLLNVADQVVVLGILVVGEAFVIISRNIDISIGSILAICAMVMADMAKNYGLSPFVIIPVGMLLGTGCGFVNGLLVAKLRMNPLVATLATYSAIRGLAFVYTDGQFIYPLPDSYRWLATLRVGGLFHANILYLVALVVVAHLVLAKTKFGRYVYGVGGNREAAVTSGIRVNRIVSYCYMISGALAAFGAVILTGKLASAGPKFGDPYLLTAVAAAVLGGASLFGGEGNIPKAFVGALVIVMISNGLNLMLVPMGWQQMVIGGVLGMAIYLDARRHQRG